MRMSRLLAVVVLAACGGSSQKPPAAPAEPVAAAQPVEPPAAPAEPAPPPPPAKPVEPGDPVEVSPASHKKVFEDDNVRILEVTLKPGDKAPMHKHPAHVVYIISGGKLKFTAPDGTSKEQERAAGATVINPETVHATENTGTTDFKAVVFELKKPGYTAAPAGKDPVVAGPKTYRKLEENERVRVLEVTFKPGQKVGAHAHPDHVAYVLEGGKLKITSGKEKPMEMEMAAGQAVFLPAQVHSTQNTGKTTVHAIIVELKPAA